MSTYFPIFVYLAVPYAPFSNTLSYNVLQVLSDVRRLYRKLIDEFEVWDSDDLHKSSIFQKPLVKEI